MTEATSAAGSALLDDEQRQLLAWVRDQDHHAAQWSESRSHLVLSGPNGSIQISTDTWHKSWNLVISHCRDGRMFVLSHLGKALLADAEARAA